LGVDPAFSKEPDPVTIRIAVIKNADHITLTVKGRYKIFSLYTHELLHEDKRVRKARITPTISGLVIGKTPFKIFGIRIVPSKDATIFINRRRFRGSVDVIRTEDLKLLVVNHVDVEQYLYGVLYHEVSHWWNMEVLKAQAIAARTFALYQSRQRKEKDYDLTCDVYSQVYGGRTSERWRTTRAVKLTKGKVLSFNGDIFPTYYHATCAGYTLDASKLWKIKLAPLKGVKCTYCKRSPHYNWRKDIYLKKIEESLKRSGYDIKGISSIYIDTIDETKRAVNIVLKSKDKTIKVPSNRFRLAVGPNSIRSTNFDITLKKGVVRFAGSGWGHGVGLCQWGAHFMSKKRYKVEEILNFYYPTAEITDYEIDRF